MQDYVKAPNLRDSDEIDLGQLMLSIWATRGRVVLSLLAVVALFSLYLAVSFFTDPKTVRYSYVFDLTFEGLKNGKFPNDSAFMLSDMTSPVVLNRVYRQNKLEDYGLELDDFRRSINIQPHAPDYPLIKAKYLDLLADKKLDAASIAELQKRMAEELKSATSGSVLITMQLPESQKLPDANKILLDIGSVWGKRAIDELGVLKPSIPVYSPQIFDQARYEHIDEMLSIDLLLSSIELVRKNIKALKNEPNAATLLDEESGYTLIDLEKALQDIVDYDISQTVDPIKGLGISRNKEAMTLYYTRRLRNLNLEQTTWHKRAQAIRGVLNDYAKDGPSTSLAASSPGNQVPQLGDAFLDRLLDVSRQGSDLEYRQKLTSEALIYENNAIDVQRNISDVQSVLLALQAGEGDTHAKRDTYLQNFKDSLPAVLSTLRDYTAAVVRLYEKQGRQVAGNASQLLEPQGGSFEVQAPKLVSATNIKILMLILVLTAFISLFLCLMADMLRGRRESV